MQPIYLCIIMTHNTWYKIATDIVTLYSITSSLIAGCDYLAGIGHCDFYKCVDNAVPCGKDGYALGFGDRYCNRITEHYNKFTADVSGITSAE